MTDRELIDLIKHLALCGADKVIITDLLKIKAIDSIKINTLLENARAEIAGGKL